MAANPEDALVGRWGPLELRADGLGALVPFMCGVWTADEKVIKLAKANGETLALPYRLEGEKLFLTLDGKDKGPLERAKATADFTPPKRAAPKRLAYGFVRAGERVFSEVELPDTGGFFSLGSGALWVEVVGAGPSFTPVDKVLGTDGSRVLCITKGGATPPRSSVAEGLDGKKLKVLGVDSTGNSYITDGKSLFCGCARLVRTEEPRTEPPWLDFDLATFNVRPDGLVEDSSGRYRLYGLIHDELGGPNDVDIRIRDTGEAKPEDSRKKPRKR